MTILQTLVDEHEIASKSGQEQSNEVNQHSQIQEVQMEVKEMKHSQDELKQKMEKMKHSQDEINHTQEEMKQKIENMKQSQDEF